MYEQILFRYCPICHRLALRWIFKWNNLLALKSLSLSLSLKFNESIVLFLRRLKSEPMVLLPPGPDPIKVTTGAHFKAF